jgi:hypothetical protein
MGGIPIIRPVKAECATQLTAAILPKDCFWKLNRLNYIGLRAKQWRLAYLARSDPAAIKLKSLILAQIERWRHALHMQVERQRGGNPGGERRTGE